MGWSEADSGLFIDEGDYFVPDRARQIGIICDLVTPLAGPGHIVELCCGAGLLTRALLERFPSARLHAFDGSPTMLASTTEAAGELAARLETRQFDLAAADWRFPPFRADAVVSSLAVHHLDGAEKQALFADLAGMIAPGGVFVLADLMAPASERGAEIAAEAWDEAVKERAQLLDGNLAAFERFRRENWNYYADPGPDPLDKPSSLLDQMNWLAAAGFVAVDLHWMRAGHAILSAVRP